MRAMLLLVAAVGCGRVAFDPVVNGDAAVASDGDATAPPCSLGPWGGLTRLSGPGLATVTDDWEPALSPDGTVLVFGSRRTTVESMYVTTRATPADAFGPPRELTELYTAGTEGGSSAMWSRDGSRLFFLHLPTRTSRVAMFLGGDTFGAPSAAGFPVGSEGWALSTNELELFYTVDMTGMDYDLFHATRPTVADAWVPDAEAAALDRTGVNQDDGWPTLDEARDEIFFEVAVGTGSVVAKAQRAGSGSPFDAPVQIDELLPESGDPDLSPDGRTLVISSERTGGAGLTDLYIVTRSCQ